MAFVVIELLIFIILVIIGFVALIYKIDRYKTKDHAGEGWQKTGEKFMDKGKLIEVHYNPKTGERVYKESKS